MAEVFSLTSPEADWWRPPPPLGRRNTGPMLCDWVPALVHALPPECKTRRWDRSAGFPGRMRQVWYFRSPVAEVTLPTLIDLAWEEYQRLNRREPPVVPPSPVYPRVNSTITCPRLGSGHSKAEALRNVLQRGGPAIQAEVVLRALEK